MVVIGSFGQKFNFSYVSEARSWRYSANLRTEKSAHKKFTFVVQG
jgi:hypothetical protein